LVPFSTWSSIRFLFYVQISSFYFKFFWIQNIISHLCIKRERERIEGAWWKYFKLWPITRLLSNTLEFYLIPVHVFTYEHHIRLQV
jgi:hypothetical protein